MKHEEAKLQFEIVKKLQEMGIYFFSVPNEANGRSQMQQMRMVSMGLRSGVSDMVIMLPGGKVLFFEIKTPIGKQSPQQARFEEKCKALGFEYYIIRSLSDVDKALGV